jgi:hypothetical protein
MNQKGFEILGLDGSIQTYTITTFGERSDRASIRKISFVDFIYSTFYKKLGLNF